MGHVIGGWEYIWSAYALAWGAVGAFCVSLFLQRSKEKS